MPTVFVDRGASLAALEDVARTVSRRRGGALVVEGDSGMGKSRLLAEFVRRAQADPELAECRYVAVRCPEEIGPGNSYGPVLDALSALREPPRPPTWWRRIGRGAARSAPDLLAALVPGLGPVIQAGRGFTEAAIGSGSVPGDSLQPYRQAVAVQLADALLTEARSGPPLVVLIDDVQHIDEDSLHVLHRALDLLPESPLGLVFGYGRYGCATHGNGAAVDTLLHRWARDGAVAWHRLEGLPSDAVAELVDALHLESAPAALPARLSEVTGGHPIFVDQCLRLWRPEDGERVRLPADLPRAVEERFHGLDPSVRRLLFIAATEGESFLSRVVADATGLPHDEVMDVLRDTERRHGFIRYRQDPEMPEWARWTGSDLYDFEHRALWRGIYKLQTVGQRYERHARVATALARLAGQDPQQAPWELRLAIARQLRRGGPACMADSAAAHYELARSAAIDQLAFQEAEQHCEVAIATARELPGDGAERDRRLVEAIELLLSLTEVRWRGRAEPAGGPDIDALAAEAEQAAARLGDRLLIARTTLLRGKTLLVTEGLVPSLEKLRAAVERAAECGPEGTVALFIAKVEYGRQLPKRDLAAGLRVLMEAEELYASEPALGERRNPVLQHARNLNEMQLGVNLFDVGRLDEARTRLLRCTTRLRDEPLRAELPIALNYLAQVHLATGEDEEARAVLREAREFEEERGGDSGWHAYNGALLALSLAGAPATRAEALRLAEDSWLETERTWLANLVPIVRNLYAEVLLEAAGTGRGLEQSYRLAEFTCEEARNTGMIRSEIAAWSLRGRIRLRQGDTDAAVRAAREALRLLGEVGDMPALRTEEVVYHAARALHAGGAGQEARELLERARAEVSRKADHIGDPDRRRRFLSEVPLNRRIRRGELNV